MDKIKGILERLYNSFDFEVAVQRDPIRFPKKYKQPLDIEIAGIIASSFAYGSMRCFCNFLEVLFKIIGQCPSDFLLNLNPSFLLEKLKKRKIKYRFSSADEIVAFLFILKKLLEQSPLKTLEYYFKVKNFKSDNHIDKISNFVQSALDVDLTPVYGENIRTHGLLYFFPDPRRGSPCKRINLFLRWMTRKRDVDFGIWKRIKPNELIIPLDTHIFNISRNNGITERKTQDLITAIEITEFFKKINPKDPLKYDFMLCHRDREQNLTF